MSIQRCVCTQKERSQCLPGQGGLWASPEVLKELGLFVSKDQRERSM